MIISRTPYRISFFGGGTDYPAWYREHGGSVLATTIDKYCYLTCRYLPPFFEHRYRVVWSKIEAVENADDITHPVVHAILTKHMKLDAGLEIHHDGDLPARSGVGSSSAFTVGFLNALHALQGHMSSKRELALESIYVEQKLLKETVGSQDQVLTTYGGFNHITFHADSEFAVHPVTIPLARIRALNDHLMLFYTGIKRTAADVASSYVDDIGKNKRQLRITNDLVKEAISILNRSGDLTPFGELLHEAWTIKRSLSSKVSNSQIDGLYEQAIKAGAVGGKLTGAGGGGFLLLFVPPERQEGLRQTFDKLIHVPFNFETTGSQIIYFEPERDYSKEAERRFNQPLQPFWEYDQDDHKDSVIETHPDNFKG